MSNESKPELTIAEQLIKLGTAIVEGSKITKYGKNRFHDLLDNTYCALGAAAEALEPGTDRIEKVAPNMFFADHGIILEGVVDHIADMIVTKSDHYHGLKADPRPDIGRWVIRKGREMELKNAE